MSSLYWKSPSIVFLLVAYSQLVFFVFFLLDFFFLSDHILQRQSILYLRFTGQKSIATTENNSHFCFHNTSQPYSFCLGAHECGEKKAGGGCGQQGGLGPGPHTQGPFQ